VAKEASVTKLAFYGLKPAELIIMIQTFISEKSPNTSDHVGLVMALIMRKL